MFKRAEIRSENGTWQSIINLKNIKYVSFQRLICNKNGINVVKQIGYRLFQQSSMRMR
jgi:hypothetical protein